MTDNPHPDLGIDGPGERLADPRGIRVTLSPGSAVSGLPPLVVEPPGVPLVALTRIAGHGLLGGTAPMVAAPPAHDRTGEPAIVLANGHAVTASLVRLDPSRAVLSRGQDPGVRTHVLLLPPAAADDGARGVVRREVVVEGWRVEVEVEPAARAALRERARRGRAEVGESGPTEVHAIIPGVVVSISVIAGDAVTAGQQLLVVEAMKMQNELRAPRDGTIQRVGVAAGQTIEVGDLLLVLA